MLSDQDRVELRNLLSDFTFQDNEELLASLVRTLTHEMLIAGVIAQHSPDTIDDFTTPGFEIELDAILGNVGAVAMDNTFRRIKFFLRTLHGFSFPDGE